jgi:hypothetical protein
MNGAEPAQNIIPSPAQKVDGDLMFSSREEVEDVAQRRWWVKTQRNIHLPPPGGPSPQRFPDRAVELTVMMNISILAVARANVALVAMTRCLTWRICPSINAGFFPMCPLDSTPTPGSRTGRYLRC